jgi:hypothetical protein
MQIKTTVDYATDSWLTTFFTGEQCLLLLLVMLFEFFGT